MALKQPLCAYNEFFKDERAKLLAELNKTVENDDPESDPTTQVKRLDFQTLAKQVSARWREIDRATREKYEAIAGKNREEYHRAVAEYKERKYGLSKPKRKKSKHSGPRAKDETNKKVPGKPDSVTAAAAEEEDDDEEEEKEEEDASDNDDSEEHAEESDGDEIQSHSDRGENHAQLEWEENGNNGDPPDDSEYTETQGEQSPNHGNGEKEEDDDMEEQEDIIF